MAISKEPFELPSKVANAILRASKLVDNHNNPVVGYDFNNGLYLDALMRSLYTTSFQATHLGQAIIEVNRMVCASFFFFFFLFYHIELWYLYKFLAQ
jgi:deoxyhypusine synthase